MKPFTTIAVGFLFLVAVLHVVRLFAGFEVMIGGNTVPQWVSGPAAVVFSALAYLVYRESRR